MTLRLDLELSQELRREAERTGRTQASLVAEAVRRLLQDDLPPGGKRALPPPTPYKCIQVDLLPRSATSSIEVLDELRMERF